MHAHPSTIRAAAIIVAAGSSRRMGMDKLTWPLGGIPVLLRTIRTFLQCPSILQIVVVCPEERWLEINPSGFGDNILRVDGGENRQDSVANGLAAIQADLPLVAVHDAARPLVSPDDIERCLSAAATHGAASLAHRVTDTLKRSNAGDFCCESVDRENLWAMETPQAFHTPLLHAAYAEVSARGLVVTDEVSAVQATGVATKLVESLHPNIKITTPADLSLATSLLENRDS